MTNTADVEASIGQAITSKLRDLGILPDGYKVVPRLYGANRKKHRDAEFARNWHPESDSIRLTFEQTEAGEQESPGAPNTPLHDVVRALHRAETRPGYGFVSLKWFRDNALPSEGFPWDIGEAARHDVLQQAIDLRWILTSKIANPRPPNFPVTAIRLNRQMPEVNAVLGVAPADKLAFRPLAVRGEPLSATMLRDRR